MKARISAEIQPQGLWLKNLTVSFEKALGLLSPSIFMPCSAIHFYTSINGPLTPY